MRRSNLPLFEYACHEGNYGMEGTLTGARAVERESASTAVASPSHVVRTAKFTVGDAEVSKAFYEQMCGMTEINRYVDEGRLIEPFVGYRKDLRLGLLAYTEQETIEKSPYPVAVLYSDEFDLWTKRIEDAQYPLFRLPSAETGGVRIAIASDPSGNAIEIIERAGPPALGGSRLIVDDRQEAEAFIVRIFGETGVTPGLRFKTDAFDEVIMNFGGDLFVALFEPKGVAPLPKSKHPVVAIYTTEYDAVLERVIAEGLGYRELRPGVLLLNDPSGNVVEVVRQRPE